MADATKITYYYTSVSGNMEVKKQQQRIEMILEAKKEIDLVKVDISSSTEDKDKMRLLCGIEKALPPRIFNGDDYCGDFTAFDEAVEDGTLDEFLKLK